MSKIFVLWKREVQAYLLSPMAYIVMAIFLVLMGLSFSIVVQQLVRGAPGNDVVQALFASPFFWMALLITVPIITMRLFAEEKRSGTIETLMTAPITPGQLVLAKFFGALTFYILLWLPTLSYVLIINHFTADGRLVDPGILAGAYLGVLVIGATFIAAGLFFSSFSENQIVSAMATFATIAAFMLAGFLPWMADSPLLQDFTRTFSGYLHMNDFSRGSVHTQYLVFYISTCALILFATTKFLERGKWQ